jgi:phenylacetate-CoA ligase
MEGSVIRRRFIMDLWAPIVRRVIAPLWARWERSPYLQCYDILQCTQYDHPDRIREGQLQAIIDLLQHAYASTSFWRARLDWSGIRPQDLRSFEDFRAVPVLTKNDLRSHAEDMVSSLSNRTALQRKKTSGSTGVSVEVLVDEAALQWKRACTLRADEWSGWRFGERVAKVWGNPEYLKNGWRGRLRNRLLDRARYLDTLHMDEATLARFARSLRQQPPSLLFGHAHSLYLLAQYLRENGGAGFQPRGIIATAMVLHDHERQTIQSVFGRPVTNRYGCEEVSLIACECERHQGLHINSDGVYVEVLRSDGTPAVPGELGAVVVTDLFNRAMPLLRYKVGDLAVLSNRRCPCGRGLPLLERVEGRVADYVVLPGGRLISGISLTENFAMLVPGLAQFQIVQEAPMRFRFRIVRGPDFGPGSLAEIRRLATERFGPEVEFDCEYLDRIPPEPSGKYRFCISKVKNPFSSLEAAAR